MSCKGTNKFTYYYNFYDIIISEKEVNYANFN